MSTQEGSWEWPILIHGAWWETIVNIRPWLILELSASSNSCHGLTCSHIAVCFQHSFELSFTCNFFHFLTLCNYYIDYDLFPLFCKLSAQCLWTGVSYNLQVTFLIHQCMFFWSIMSTKMRDIGLSTLPTRGVKGKAHSTASTNETSFSLPGAQLQIFKWIIKPML